jgi:hypothetical protein
MLLFSDGFDCYTPEDVHYKWGYFSNPTAGNPALPVSRIVSGIDTSNGKAWATKNGRALYLAAGNALLITSFKPSRTIYLGFAYRCRGVGTTYVDNVITFLTRANIERGSGKNNLWETGTTVCTLNLRIYATRIDYTWTFTGVAQTQVASINTSMNLLSGDYHYIQIAMTLMGNVTPVPEAWCEIRVGNALATRMRHQNILTSAPNGVGYFYINALALNFTTGYYYYQNPCYTTIDDVYILNDEGTVNNSFLGNVKVRRVTPSADGADNDSTPTLKSGDAKRFQAVDEDFMGSNALPYPQPTPEQDPLFIPWELTRFDDYLTLEHRGDRQSLRFHSVDWAGSSPRIFGAIMHGLAMSKEMGIGGQSMLKGYRRSGLEIYEANEVDVPLSYTRYGRGAWQTYPIVFDNDEIVGPGQYPLIWKSEAVDDSEWVIELTDNTIDPIMYDRNLTRFNLVNEEICSEFLGFVEFVHRFYDESATDTLSAVDNEPTYERTFKIEESLYWSPEISIWRMFHKSVNDTIEFAEEIPWIYMFAQGQIGFADEIFLEWQDLVDETIGADDWTTGFWEERFTDAIDITDFDVASYIEFLDEQFGLEEPYLWDGHEDVEETLEINVTYLWDNHELMEEYLYPDDELSHGVGLSIEEEIGLDQDHFDGWLVEEMRDPLGVADSVLTQHWRYERFFGIVISSWQVNPVEQQGTDGNHNGDNPWGW